jgi:hypothetical protein
MPSFAAVWLVVLHLLAFAAPRAGAPGAGVGARASATASLHRDDARATTETPRPAAEYGGIVATRSHGGTRSLTSDALAAGTPIGVTRQAIAHAWVPVRSHAAAARGGLLAYFPTAPPRIG